MKWFVMGSMGGMFCPGGTGPMVIRNGTCEIVMSSMGEVICHGRIAKMVCHGSNVFFYECNGGKEFFLDGKLRQNGLSWVACHAWNGEMVCRRWLG